MKSHCYYLLSKHQYSYFFNTMLVLNCIYYFRHSVNVLSIYSCHQKFFQNPGAWYSIRQMHQVTNPLTTGPWDFKLIITNVHMRSSQVKSVVNILIIQQSSPNLKFSSFFMSKANSIKKAITALGHGMCLPVVNSEIIPSLSWKSAKHKSRDQGLALIPLITLLNGSGQPSRTSLPHLWSEEANSLIPKVPQGSDFSAILASVKPALNTTEF